MATHKILTDLDVGGKVITTEIESASTILLDAAADITIDAGGQDIILSDDATIFGTLSNSSGFQVRSRVNDADLLLRGVDNGTEFTALQLDMSDAGTAIFSHDIKMPSAGVINFNSGDVTLTHSSNQLAISGGVIVLDASDHVLKDGGNILDENDNNLITTSGGACNISGNAATATILANARTIGGVSFNGSANITLPGVNAEGNQNTTGTAANLSNSPNISVGTITSGNLTVNGDSITFESANADDPRFIIKNTTNDDQASRLEFQKLRADDAVATGQNLGEIWFSGQDSAQNSEEYAYIIGEIDVSTGGQESGQLTLGVAAHDGTNRTGLKLTGGSVSGEVDVQVGLGSASVTAVQGTLTAVGTITGSADVIAYSDKRLKENVKTLDGKKVLEMRGVSFDRVDTGKASSGVIAQEIEKIAPELVIDDGNFKGVAYGNIVGYLIEAIKDQQKQIDELKEICSGCSK